jgi:hypothetical protein
LVFRPERVNWRPGKIEPISKRRAVGGWGIRAGDPPSDCGNPIHRQP